MLVLPKHKMQFTMRKLDNKACTRHLINSPFRSKTSWDFFDNDFSNCSRGGKKTTKSNCRENFWFFTNHCILLHKSTDNFQFLGTLLNYFFVLFQIWDACISKHCVEWNDRSTKCCGITEVTARCRFRSSDRIQVNSSNSKMAAAAT